MDLGFRVLGSVPLLLSLDLGHFQVGSYSYRSLIEGLSIYIYIYIYIHTHLIEAL